MVHVGEMRPRPESGPQLDFRRQTMFRKETTSTEEVAKMKASVIYISFLFCVLLIAHLPIEARAQAVRIPGGIQGSAGAGFTDFKILAPQSDLKLDRGNYFSASAERGFGVLNLYVTLTLSHMSAEGTANYDYTNLSSSTTYTANDVPFQARLLDVGLGLKMKIIDGYWFRPYVEGGGLGGYHEIDYRPRSGTLDTQGSDYKRKDVIMGSGFYYEGGIEIQFGDRFGVKLAGRVSEYQTKNLETLDKRGIKFQSETYYLSGLVGF
jgi:hypothetical protein